LHILFLSYQDLLSYVFMIPNQFSLLLYLYEPFSLTIGFSSGYCSCKSSFFLPQELLLCSSCCSCLLLFPLLFLMLLSLLSLAMLFLFPFLLCSIFLSIMKFLGMNLLAWRD